MISMSNLGRRAAARVAFSSTLGSDKVSSPWSLLFQKLGFRRSQPPRLTARTPAARICFEHAGTARAAFGAVAVSRKMPCRDVIPIAANDDRAASATVGSLARGIVNVASIDVTKAGIRCNPSRLAQRLRRCRWSVGQFPVRNERP
jgi:hypothetical protein